MRLSRAVKKEEGTAQFVTARPFSPPIYATLLDVTGVLFLLGLLAVLLYSQRRNRDRGLRTEVRLEALTEYLQGLTTQVDIRVRAAEEAIRHLSADLRAAEGASREEQTRSAAALQQTIVAQLGQGSSALQQLQEGLVQGIGEVHRQVSTSLAATTSQLEQRFEQLTKVTDSRLTEIGGQVERRLQEGFKETTATFADVQRRLALIDQAQRHIQELSGHVVSLREILADKRSRGAFGEVQLAALIRNVLPENAFAFQKDLANGTRADCILFLPPPTGNVVIDAKFPLENYTRLTAPDLPAGERERATRLFKADVRRHIQDIAEKYVLAGETAEGAVMFIPAEAIFAEIHAHHPDLVDLAWRSRVWLTSPTTLMAILTTARAVLKDAATRQQVHIIQEHLVRLGEDFDRFQRRMDALARHVQQADKDMKEVHTSACKISRRFKEIEQVEVEGSRPDACPIRSSQAE